MPFNGSGTYSAPAGNPVVTGTVIQSTWANTLVTDLSNTVNNLLPRDGQAPMNAPLKLQDGTFAIPALSFNSEPATGIFRAGPNILGITTGATEGLRVSQGRVILGTATDDGANKLQLTGNAAVTGTITTTNLAVTGTFTAGSNISAGANVTSISGNVTAALGADSTGQIGSVGTTTNHAFVVRTNGTEKLRIDAAGNLVSNASVTGYWQLPAGTTAQRPTGAAGQIRFNNTNNQFEGYNGTAWGAIGGGATGGGSDQTFVNTQQIVTQNYTIPTGFNSMSAGPITIADGVSVTVPDGSSWTIV